MDIKHTENSLNFTHTSDRFSNRNAVHWAASGRFALVVALILLLATACGGGRDDEAAAAQELFRTPHPTFTPTPAAAVAQPNPAPGQSAGAGADQTQSSAPAPVTAPQEGPRAVVNAPLVNLRAGPSTTTNVVAVVERGAEYEVVGRSDDDEWWQICCEGDQAVWISREFVDTDGPVDAVPVGGAGAPVVSAPAEAAASPGLGGSASQSSFSLIAKEQFAESNLVRVYLYVYDENSALAGYSLRILKDGREIPVSAQSFGGQPAFTWPFQDARQRYQNLKVEIPDEPPAGAWSVQLIDPQGRPVGPIAEFTLDSNDPQQELYVRYERGN